MNHNKFKSLLPLFLFFFSHLINLTVCAQYRTKPLIVFKNPNIKTKPIEIEIEKEELFDTEKTYIKHDKLEISKKLKVIIDYDLSTRKNIILGVSQILLFFWTISSACISIYELHRHFLARYSKVTNNITITIGEKFLHIITIIIGFYSFVRLILGIVNLKKKETFIYNYTSYRNSLTQLKLNKLKKKIKEELEEEELSKILGRFIDVNEMRKSNILTLDPLRCYFAKKIANKTLENFSSLNSENQSIIEAIIKNYTFNYLDILVNFNCTFFIVFGFYSFFYERFFDKIYGKFSSKNKTQEIRDTCIIPLVIGFWGFFLQNVINWWNYKSFIKKIKSVDINNL